MPANSYKQYCAVARALDVVGDRWTLLMVRELSLGPRRFTDLVDGLPGISRNLLTQRLRDLQRDGIVERTELPPPAARQVYQLSDDGRDLAEAMLPLAAWGTRRLGARQPKETYRPHWGAVAMAAFANRDAAAGVTETYEFRVGAYAFNFSVENGSIQLSDGHAQRPDVVLTTDEDTWADLAAGTIIPADAAATGALEIAGDRDAALHLAKIFSRQAMLDENGRPLRVQGRT